MAFADPQSVTLNGAKTLPRISTGMTASTYSDITNGLDLSIRHNVKNRKASQVRLDIDKIAADPLTAVNQRLSASVYLIANRPITGFSVTEMKDLVVALTTWLTANSNANAIQWLGEEH